MKKPKRKLPETEEGSLSLKKKKKANNEVLSLFERWKSSTESPEILERILTKLKDSKDDDSARNRAEIDFFDFVTSLLSSYEASLSRRDQLLLEIVTFCDFSGYLDFARISPLIWGQFAAEKYPELKMLGPSLFAKPSFAEIFGNLDAKCLWYSGLNLNLTAEPVNQSEFYDPNFILPLFANLLAPEND